MGFQKGSTQALEHMAKIRALRKSKQPMVQIDSVVDNNEPVSKVATGRREKLVKGSAEAKTFMSSIKERKK